MAKDKTQSAGGEAGAEDQPAVARTEASPTKSSGIWVRFITSQSGFKTVRNQDGSTERGAQFTHSKGDVVLKPAEEAEKLIEAGTCVACDAPS